MPNNVDCLYTTVQNISGMETVFSFIPPHGKRMVKGEMLTVAGNIVDRLAVKTSKRQFQALERALIGDATHPPSLAILSTPAVFVYNDFATPHKGQAIDATAVGAIGMVDPCWGPQTVPP